MSIFLTIASALSTVAASAGTSVTTVASGPGLRRQIRSEMSEGIARKEKAKSRKEKGRDRYYMTMFSYQNSKHQAQFSHTFATYVHIRPDGTREEKTISWLPERFKRDPNLYVFKGPLSTIARPLNRVKPEKGHNYSLDETIAFGAGAQLEFGMWGPFEIKPELFGRVNQRIDYLKNSGIQYVADDRGYRKKGIATNCMHAVSDLDGDFLPLFGDFFEGWIRPWGFAGTKNVIAHYQNKKRDWMVDRINEDRIRKWHYEPVASDSVQPSVATPRRKFLPNLFRSVASTDATKSPATAFAAH